MAEKKHDVRRGEIQRMDLRLAEISSGSLVSAR